jgi:hypothetical protein
MRSRATGHVTLFVGYVVALVLSMAPCSITLAAEPPPILQITIEPILPGKEAEYAAIEEDLARLCATRGCPNSYLALLSLAAPKEVWWFVAYRSQAEVESVAASYAGNPALLEALRALTAKKNGIAAEPSEHWTKLNADLSDGAPWQIGTTRFAVIATLAAGGAVFEAPDGRRFAIVSAETLADAAETAVRLGPSARVFEIRPSWSRPDKEWTTARPELWAAQ